MNIISEKKDQQRNGPALKNQQEEGRDHSDIQHLQTSVDLEVRNHIKKKQWKILLPRVLEIANTLPYSGVFVYLGIDCT